MITADAPNAEPAGCAWWPTPSRPSTVAHEPDQSIRRSAGPRRSLSERQDQQRHPRCRRCVAPRPVLCYRRRLPRQRDLFAGLMSGSPSLRETDLTRRNTIRLLDGIGCETGRGVRASLVGLHEPASAPASRSAARAPSQPLAVSHGTGDFGCGHAPSRYGRGTLGAPRRRDLDLDEHACSRTSAISPNPACECWDNCWDKAQSRGVRRHSDASTRTCSDGARDGIRTHDLRITSALLYH